MCGPAEGSGGGGLWAGGASLSVPAVGRRDAGRSRRAHRVRALPPSEVTRRGAPGRGQGIAAQSSPPPHKKDKRDRGLGREKFSARLLKDAHRTSRPKRRRGGWGRGAGGRAGYQERGHAIATWCTPSSSRPRPVGTPPARPPPISPPASSSRMQTKSNPLPPGPPAPKTRAAAAKLHFLNRESPQTKTYL